MVRETEGDKGRGKEGEKRDEEGDRRMREGGVCIASKSKSQLIHPRTGTVSDNIKEVFDLNSTILKERMRANISVM